MSQITQQVNSQYKNTKAHLVYGLDGGISIPKILIFL